MSSFNFMIMKSRIRIFVFECITWCFDQSILKDQSSLLKLDRLGVLGSSGVLGRLVVNPIGLSMGLTVSRFAKLRGVWNGSIAGFSKLWIWIGGGRRIALSEPL
jgi:hypothetical protein